MNASTAGSIIPRDSIDAIRFGRQILRAEGRFLIDLAEQLGREFSDACGMIHDTSGAVIVTGMGKAGLVGQKISATLASTGTKSFFLHPSEAIHGDLGRVGPADTTLVLSQSGQTDEIVQLLPSLSNIGSTIVAITASGKSTLGKSAAITLELGSLEEAGELGLAPSTSTTAMMAIGDAIALVVSRMRGFSAEDFARFHPGGSLGRKLSRVEEVMRPLRECRIAHEECTIRDVFVAASRPGRRSGAIMLVDSSGRLCGLFTDSDLARLFENRCENQLDEPIRSVMTSEPAAITIGTMLAIAMETLASRKISELPVVDPSNRPVGLIDITDVVAQEADATGDLSPQSSHLARDKSA